MIGFILLSFDSDLGYILSALVSHLDLWQLSWVGAPYSCCPKFTLRSLRPDRQVKKLPHVGRGGVRTQVALGSLVSTALPTPLAQKGSPELISTKIDSLILSGCHNLKFHAFHIVYLTQSISNMVESKHRGENPLSRLWHSGWSKSLPFHGPPFSLFSLSTVLNRDIVEASERALELQLGVRIWAPRGGTHSSSRAVDIEAPLCPRVLPLLLFRMPS